MAAPRIPLWPERRDYGTIAVLVEGGGTGADSAGPIADAFLHPL